MKKPVRILFIVLCVVFIGVFLYSGYKIYDTVFAPGGYLYGWVESLAHGFGGDGMAQASVEVFSSRVVFFSLFVVAFIAWNLQRKLQESAEFEAAKESGQQTGLLENIKVLFRNRIAVKTVAFLASVGFRDGLFPASHL